MKDIEQSRVDKAARRHGGRLFHDLCARHPEVLRLRADGVRQVGFKTRHERRIFLRAALRRLAELGYRPPVVDALKTKHLRALCRDMETRNLKPATIATCASHLALLYRCIGKQHLVGNMAGYFSDPAVLHRSEVAQRDKSLEGAGLVFSEIYQRALEVDERVACMLQLCHTFGLRVREAWLLRPHEAIQEGVICIYWGTKGGRKRQLAFAPTEEHRQLIDEAKTFAATAAESMIPRGVSLKEWKSRWQRAMVKIGLTRRQLGVTPHSLRHSMLCRRFTQVSGHPAPVRGGELHKIDPGSDRAARDLIADLAGHSRRSVASAYIGGARR